jgi:eukaryotic-like serine/threonine-protein kinase
MAQDQAQSLVGRQVGPYKIHSLLGVGGMGEVYLAQDPRLDRTIALKILPTELASEPARIQRFIREARAASGLKHPNVATIYEIGKSDEFHFIAMEYVEGQTLAAKIGGSPLPIAEIVDIGIQVADALDEAHRKGITHRDIKPANLMLTSREQVKILDFGLAKVAQPEGQELGSDISTVVKTETGVVMGTVQYMSPEQVLGREVDARTDIFSLGVVLYEMATGRLPFTGSSSSETMDRILHGQPDAIARFNYNVPAELERIIRKCLEKDRERRYQSARELLIDLKNLKRDGDSVAAAVAGESHEKWRTVLRSRRTLRTSALVALMALSIVGALLLFRFRQPAAPARLEYTQLTNFADSATSPALSPDGRMLTFIRGESTFVGPGQIYVKLLPDGDPVQLTNDSLEKMSPKFSSDGARIAYTSLQAGSQWDTWVVPVLGGQPRLFLSNAEGLTWIKAGAGQPRLLFSEMTGRGQQMGIVTSTESRAQQRTVYMPPEESGMAHRSYLSPDGKQILLVEMKFSTWLPCRLTPFDGSSPGKPVGPAPAQCTDAAWSPDGEWMYFSANTGNGYHIWRQRFPDGALEQVTSGVTQEEGIEFAPDGRSFVTSIGTSQSTLWIHDSSGDRQITSEGFAFFPSISPDSKKLYYLVRAGGARNIVSGELWVADLQSGQRQRLLPDFLMRHYTISADGERVVFVVADEAGRSPVWLATLNRRSAPRQITASHARKAFFGAGGNVVFLGQDKGTNFMYRVKEDGSELPQVVPTPHYLGRELYLADYGLSVSPDGKWVVVSGPTEAMPGAVVVYPVGGGSPTLICRTCAQGRSFERGPGPYNLSWSSDGKFLYLNFQQSIYAIPLRPGQVLPPMPASGFQTKQDVTALPGARLIAEGAFAGPNPSVYAFTKFATQRNIYRVPVP